MATYVHSKSGLTDEEKETVDAVICMRVSDLPVCHIPGSKKDKCKMCGCEVWTAPTAPAKPPRLCFVCAMELETTPRQ